MIWEMLRFRMKGTTVWMRGRTTARSSPTMPPTSLRTMARRVPTRPPTTQSSWRRAWSMAPPATLRTAPRASKTTCR